MKYDLDALVRAARVRKLKGFKLIIAGSRHLDTKAVKKVIREHWGKVCKQMGAKPDYIISGGAKGVDRAGELVAKKLTGREAIVFPANWDLLGKSAGPSRNLDMVSVANGLLIIWDGKSRGSRHILGCMEIRKRPIFEIEVELD
jgi:hypothetical protein